MNCHLCDGRGGVSGHDEAPYSHNPETGECRSCPVQIFCQTCEGTGQVELEPTPRPEWDNQ